MADHILHILSLIIIMLTSLNKFWKKLGPTGRTDYLEVLYGSPVRSFNIRFVYGIRD